MDARCLIPVVEFVVILLLPHKSGVIVRDSAVTVVRKAHRMDRIDTVPGAETGDMA